MKKHVLIGLLGVSLIAVIALAFLMAAPKPIQYTWKAVILDSSQNLTGGTGGVYDNSYPGWVYNDGDEFANVMVVIREYIGRGNVRTYETVFWLEVLSPTQVSLQGMTVGPWGSDETFKSCGFTGFEGASLPSCWQSFLNGSHPKDGYQRASFMHAGARFATREEADFNNMFNGESRVMRLHFLTQGQEIMGSCDQCNPDYYHQIDGDAHGDAADGSGCCDIYLTRVDQNTWKVVVNTNFDKRQDKFPAAFSWTDDKLWESYCECVKVGKRTVKKTRQSTWVRTHLGYQMIFIRTPK